MTQAERRTGSSARIRLGIVGLGLAGSVMTAAARTHPAFEIAGAAEPNDELRLRFRADHGVVVHADAAQLFARDDIDAVYIATPHPLHAQQAIAAAEHGKHVIVEKPMALSLEECDAMIEAARRCAVVLMIGHTHAYDPALATMRELMASSLGEAASVISLNYTDFLYRPRRPEELDTARGGGIVFNQLPHQIGIARALIDSPIESVAATTSVLDHARPTEGACQVLLRFRSGAAATLIYSGYDGFDSDELHGGVGEGGAIKPLVHGAARRALDDLDGDAERALRRTRYGYGAPRPSQPAHQPHFGMLLVSCPGGDLRPTADGVAVYTARGVREVAVPRAPWRPGWGDVLEALRAAIAGERPPSQDGAAGREALAVCLAVLRSAAERREIRLEALAS